MASPVLVIAVMGIVVAEMVLSGSWTLWYFRRGIPIYSRRLPIRTMVSASTICDALTDAFPRSWMPRQVFWELSNSEIAFREKVFEITLLNYTPIMRGLISLVPMERAVFIKGFLNWYVIGFGMLGVMIAIETPLLDFAAMFLAAFILVVAVCYTIQARSYNRVREVLGQHVAGGTGGGT